MKKLFLAFFAIFVLTLPSIVVAQTDEEPPAPDEQDDYYEEDKEPEEENAVGEKLLDVFDVDVEDLRDALEEGEYLKKLRIDMRVVFDYIFEEGGAYAVTYTIKLEGNVNSKVSVIKGNAEIIAEADGPLSKWPTGECKLMINIPKIPFEIAFRKTGEEKARINLRFKGNIMENWESQCSFEDAPGAKFNTSGPPEKWLNQALAKASPPLRSLAALLNPDEETTSTSQIAQFSINDQPIGNAQIEGTIITTIIPID